MLLLGNFYHIHNLCKSNNTKLDRMSSVSYYLPLQKRSGTFFASAYYGECGRSHMILSFSCTFLDEAKRKICDEVDVNEPVLHKISSETCYKNS